jgi:FeS assembly SUF system protein
MKTIPLIPPADAQSASAPATEPTAIVRDEARTEALKPKIVEAISTVYDPEIPVNIFELGLVYDIAVDAQNVALVTMTLTAPGCPAAQSLPVEVADKVKAIEGIADAKVDVVWEPAWTKDRMSEAARLQLGLW